jgi:hypothetical protein
MHIWNCYLLQVVVGFVVEFSFRVTYSNLDQKLFYSI